MDVKKINGFTLKDESARQSLEEYKQTNDAAVEQLASDITGLGESVEQANTANTEAHEQIVTDMTALITSEIAKERTTTQNQVQGIGGIIRGEFAGADEQVLADAKAYADEKAAGVVLEKGKKLGTTEEGSTLDPSFLDYTVFLVGGVLCTVRDVSVVGVNGSAMYKYISGVGAGAPNMAEVDFSNPAYMSVRILLTESDGVYTVVSSDRYTATMNYTSFAWSGVSDTTVRDIIGVY